MSQQHPRITLEGFTGPGAQITVADLMQLTPMPDGSVVIDLAGSGIEVERIDGSHRMVIRRTALAKTLVTD